MRTRRRLHPLLLLLAAVGMLGCGTTLTVRHLDATHTAAQVSVDGQPVGLLTFGDQLELPIQPGPHKLRATTPGGQVSPWHPEVDVLEIVIEGDAVLTLQPRGPGR
mgnify:CR=1 FL=1